MQNKNTLMWVVVIVLALVVGAFWGSKYGFTLKGPFSNSGLKSHANLEGPGSCRWNNYTNDPEGYVRITYDGSYRCTCANGNCEYVFTPLRRGSE